MLATRTSPSLAPSLEELTRAQNLAQRGSSTRISRQAKRAAIQPADRDAHPGGARRRIGSPIMTPAREEIRPSRAAEPWRASGRLGASFILASPAGIHGPETANIAL
jgi:hypothetical protein